MHTVDLDALSTRERYQLMISAIVPRPVALISTVDAAGIVNVAPFSYFNGVCSSPPLISVCIGLRKVGDQRVKKDTWRNIAETREFVVNIASHALTEKVNACAAEYPSGVSELEAVGLTAVESDVVEPPRVGECAVQLECRLAQLIELGDPVVTGMVLGQIVAMHIDDTVWDADKGVVDVRALDPVVRLGAGQYGKIIDTHDWVSPDLPRALPPR